MRGGPGRRAGGRGQAATIFVISLTPLFSIALPMWGQTLGVKVKNRFMYTAVLIGLKTTAHTVLGTTHTGFNPGGANAHES